MNIPHHDPIQNKLGGIDALNCGEGHLELRYDKDDAIEMENAKRTITDMLRRGYALFIPGQDSKMIRVDAFDPQQGVYIIGAGANPVDINDQPVETEAVQPRDTPVQNADAPKGITSWPRTRGKRGVKMDKVRVTAIARSAGG